MISFGKEINSQDPQVRLNIVGALNFWETQRIDMMGLSLTEVSRNLDSGFTLEPSN